VSQAALEPSIPPARCGLQAGNQPHGCQYELASELAALEGYLIAIPAIMVGSILLVGAIVLLFESRHNGDSDVRRG